MTGDNLTVITEFTSKPPTLKNMENHYNLKLSTLQINTVTITARYAGTIMSRINSNGYILGNINKKIANSTLWCSNISPVKLAKEQLYLTSAALSAHVLAWTFGYRHCSEVLQKEYIYFNQNENNWKMFTSLYQDII